MGFPGRCAFCFGPQQWTYIAGELYVRCESECAPELPLEYYPPVSEGDMGWPVDEPKGSETEPPEEGRVGTLEGGAADEVGCPDQMRSTLEEPPPGFLAVLWEGFEDV